MWYERAKALYKEHINDGWTPDAACNDAAISYPLSLDEQNKLWKYRNRYFTPLDNTPKSAIV